MNIAVIPARGGSKRIPKKNIKLFCGKPIITYAIEAAFKSGVFDHVIVSTDDVEISRIALESGAEVPFVRPNDLSDDYTPTVSVVRHAIEWVAAHLGPVTNVCCIYSTAPFVLHEDIRKAYTVLVQQRVMGYVFTATSFSFPIQRAFRMKEDGHCEMLQPEHYNTRSQDLEETYQDAGQFYWGAAQSYLSDKIFFSEDSKPYVIPRYRVQDIDTMQDWIRAELMWSVQQQQMRVESDS